ncbi:MAG: ATP-dependent helicase [Deltaproteobacteria bacterium]|nr:MAG: ATP-dependent helicase [Deltaproteobacteria bacterium]
MSDSTFTLILAGAGTGKTHLLTLYFLKSILENKRPLAITFSQKATNEIKERIINSIIKNNLPINNLLDLPIQTFHSFCIQSLSYKHAPIQIISPDENFKEILQEIHNTLKENVSYSYQINKKSFIKGIFTSICKIQENDISPLINRNTPTRMKWHLDVDIKMYFLLSSIINIENTHPTLYLLANIFMQNKNKLTAKYILDKTTILFSLNQTKQLEKIQLKSILAKLLSTIQYLNSVFISNMIIQILKRITKTKIPNHYSLTNLVKEGILTLQTHTKLPQFNCILIDECQDISPNQNKLIYLLSKKNTKTFLIGDQKQSIYSFRGATLESSYFNTRNTYLVSSRRSSSSIIYFSNFVSASTIARLKPADLLTSEKKNKIAGGILGKNFIQKIIFWIQTNKFHLSDITILSRRSNVFYKIQETLRNAKIPTNLSHSYNIYDQREIIDIISILYILTLHKSTFIKIKKCICSFSVYANHTPTWLSTSFILSLKTMLGIKPLSQIIDRILIEGQYLTNLSLHPDLPQKLFNISKLKESTTDFVENYKNEINNFLDSIRFSHKNNNKKNEVEPSSPAINLMTLHQSKGLEFPVVVLIDLNFYYTLKQDTILYNPVSDSLPQLYISSQTLKKDKGFKTQTILDKTVHEIKKTTEAESARLLYVGITRAKNYLYFVIDKQDNSYGNSLTRFLMQTQISNPFLFNSLMPLVK